MKRREDAKVLTPLYPKHNNDYHDLVARHGLDLSRFRNYPVIVSLDGRSYTVEVPFKGKVYVYEDDERYITYEAVPNNGTASIHIKYKNGNKKNIESVTYQVAKLTDNFYNQGIEEQIKDVLTVVT